MELPMLGSSEQRPSSKYQITLVDERNSGQKPMDYPRINRFFDNKEDRTTFLKLFESSVQRSEGQLVVNPFPHPLFISFFILDKEGKKDFSIAVYM